VGKWGTNRSRRLSSSGMEWRRSQEVEVSAEAAKTRFRNGGEGGGGGSGGRFSRGSPPAGAAALPFPGSETGRRGGGGGEGTRGFL
jgi:hypothetical protein